MPGSQQGAAGGWSSRAGALPLSQTGCGQVPNPQAAGPAASLLPHLPPDVGGLGAAGGSAHQATQGEGCSSCVSHFSVLNGHKAGRDHL